MENDNSQLHYMQISVDHMDMMEYLTDEQCGIAFRLIFAYFRGQKTKDEIIAEIDSKNRIILPIFEDVRKSIDRGRGAYEERCQKNRENGKKGGAPKGNQNARKKKGAPRGEDRQATEPTETAPPNESEDTDSETAAETAAEKDKRIMTGVAQSILPKLQAELSVYKTSLFKFFSEKQAIKFLALFMTITDFCGEMSFDYCYKSGAIGFLDEMELFEGNAKKYLDSFEKYVKDQYLSDCEFITVDDYIEDMELNTQAAANAIKAYLKEHRAYLYD